MAQNPIVSFIVPSFAGGGAERVMLTLLAWLDRARFKPSLIVLTAEGPLAAMCPGDVSVTVLGRSRVRGALPALRRALNDQRPDIVITTMGYLNLAVLALRPWLRYGPRVVVREANAVSATTGTGIRGRLTRSAYRRLYPCAHRVICPASFIRDELLGLGVPDEKLHILFNPVDEPALRRAAAKPMRRAGPGRRFVAAGRLTRQKGFDRLIGLIAHLDADDHVTVFGEGEDRASLAASARSTGVGDRIEFAGYTDPLAPWIAGADAFLLPSRWEGMPNAALESLALGTPVIATPEAGGIVDIEALVSESVVLASAGDAFAAAMGAIGCDPVDRPRPSLLPDAFRIDAVVAGFEAILDGQSAPNPPS